MLRIPIHLGPIPRIHQILHRQPMQAPLLSQHPHHIPANAIDIDPARLRPGRARLSEKGGQRGVGVVVRDEARGREVVDADSAGLAEATGGVSEEVGMMKVEAGERAAMPKSPGVTQNREDVPDE